MRFAFLISALLILMSCKDEDKGSLLSPEKMESVLLEFVMAEAHTNLNVNADSVVLSQKENTKWQKRIFAFHGITREQFQASFDYYTNHPAEFTVILDSISAKENRRNIAPLNLKYE